MQQQQLLQATQNINPDQIQQVVDGVAQSQGDNQ
jgi:hypothetical protein